MRRAHCGSEEGTAIRTTFGRLREAVADAWTVTAPVPYLDFETERLPSRNLAFPLLCKRIEFAHEREVRVLLEASAPTLSGKIRRSRLAAEP